MSLNPYLAQLQQLAVPLAIAAVIVVFSLVSFGVWARRIRHVGAAIQQLQHSLASNTRNSRSALQQAQADTRDPQQCTRRVLLD